MHVRQLVGRRRLTGTRRIYSTDGPVEPTFFAGILRVQLVDIGVMFFKESLISLLGWLSFGLAQNNPAQDPSAKEIAKSRATVQPYSPVSNVEGLAFNRFVNIWLENTVSISDRG